MWHNLRCPQNTSSGSPEWQGSKCTAGQSHPLTPPPSTCPQVRRKSFPQARGGTRYDTYLLDTYLLANELGSYIIYDSNIAGELTYSRNVTSMGRDIRVHDQPDTTSTHALPKHHIPHTHPIPCTGLHTGFFSWGGKKILLPETMWLIDHSEGEGVGGVCALSCAARSAETCCLIHF